MNDLQLNTGLKGFKNYFILKKLRGQMTDGVWEDDDYVNYLGFNIAFALNENDEVLMGYLDGIFTDDKNEKMTPKEVRKWIADRLKEVIKEEEKWHKKDGSEWKRDCKCNSHLLGQYHDDDPLISIGEIYRAYDVLLERDISKFTYGTN